MSQDLRERLLKIERQEKSLKRTERCLRFGILRSTCRKFLELMKNPGLHPILDHSDMPRHDVVLEPVRDVEATQHNATTLLLRLPPELRNMIYGFIVHEEMRAIYICTKSSWLYTNSPWYTPGLVPALAQTCQTLRSEVLPMYYCSNKAIWRSPVWRTTDAGAVLDGMHGWLEGMKQRGFLESIERLQLNSGAIVYQRHWYSKRVCSRFVFDLGPNGYLITTEVTRPREKSTAEIRVLKLTSEHVARDLIALIKPIMPEWNWQLFEYTHIEARPHRWPMGRLIRSQSVI